MIRAGRAGRGSADRYGEYGSSFDKASEDMEYGERGLARNQPAVPFFRLFHFVGHPDLDQIHPVCEQMFFSVRSIEQTA